MTNRTLVARARSRAEVAAARLGAARSRELVVLAAFALLFLVVTLAFRHQQSDEGAYVQYARNLAHGFYANPQVPHRWFDPSSPVLWFGPGLPILIAPLAALHAPLEVMRLVGPILFFLTVLLFLRTLRLGVSRRAAFVGAVAFAAYVPVYALLPSLHSEVLAAFQMTAFMYATGRYLRDGSRVYLALGVLALAWLAVTRPVFGWIVSLAAACWLVAWLLRRDRASGRLALLHVAAVCLCVPWLAYTYSLSHNVFYWASSGGQSLYWMASSNPGQLGDWHSESDVFTRAELRPDRSEFRKIQGRTEIESDRILRRDSEQLIRAAPARYAKRVLQNVSRMWFSTPFSYTQQKLSTTAYILPNSILLIALVVSAGLAWTMRRRLPVEVAAWSVLLVIGLVVQSLLAAYTRMLVPLVPLMLGLIVYVLSRASFGGPRPGASPGNAS